MSTDVAQLLDKIKNMKEYVVIREMPEMFVFGGVVPFNMSVRGNQATFKVLAASLEDAEEKVDAYLSSNTHD